ncbi:UDP-N-acetylglucosamine--N-acetylmuramyl-(pentapeptide) pyrophosphoryl-undecaprenol N-acetylglucosamine transferase [Candidatus Sumerlaeota bacterium]|nr:UDP-N-acetylglucosamine--N-acetylmuramyl-(pentapeptide) pyrophosphoryl-undecaprenol N-acetylglucosamine transferase [Candidatus Sumerlaeota bacterium]
MKPRQPILAFAAGGTGGHIAPAIATAQAVRRLRPDVETRFFSGCRENELAFYHSQQIEPLVLPVGRFGYGIRGKLRLARELWQARAIALRAMKPEPPDCLLSMGGYVSFATVLAARKLSVPIVLHEQNALLGQAHRMSRRWADLLACSYLETMDQGRGIPTERTGNPVREGIAAGSRDEAIREFDLAQSGAISGCSRCVLICGGSQGARGVNRLILKAFKSLDRNAEKSDLRLTILWQCGSGAEDDLREALRELSLSRIDVRLLPFIQRMELAYAAADLILARAGASSLAEITVCGKPAIFFPLPTAKEDHQTLNAKAAVDAGAALLIREESASPEELAGTIGAILSDDERLAAMATASRNIGRPDAAETLAKILLRYVRE